MKPRKGYLAGRKAAPEGWSMAQRKEEGFFPLRRFSLSYAPLHSLGGPNSLAVLFRPPLPYLERWLSPSSTRPAGGWAGCRKFLIGGVAKAPGEKSFVGGAPSSGVASTVRQDGGPQVLWDVLRGQARPLLVTGKRAAYSVGGTGRGGGPTATSCRRGAGRRTTIWPRLGVRRRKLCDFRSREGPAVTGGRKAEGTLRGSEISSEGRLERPFLRWGPDRAGSEGRGGNVEGEVLGSPRR